MSRNRRRQRLPRLYQRARIRQQIRAFFIQQGFLEVETPARIPANAPEAWIDPFPSGSWQLQTSPELAMKRLLAAGYPDLFQIAPVWRQEERGRQHLPEFTLLEWYSQAPQLTALRQQCQQLLQTLVPEGDISYQGRRISLAPPWPCYSVAEALAMWSDQDPDRVIAQGCLDQVWSLEVEPRLPLKPLFIHAYPAQEAALARLDPVNPATALRLELYIGGLELANGFSELRDSQQQRQRFETTCIKRQARQAPETPLPEPFLADLPHMPPCSGMALGLDRLVMLLTDTADISDVVAFTPEEL